MAAFSKHWERPGLVIPFINPFKTIGKGLGAEGKTTVCWRVKVKATFFEPI